MHLKTILNRIQRHPGFVYTKFEWGGETHPLLITLRPRRGSLPICSGCGKQGPGYDTLKVRRFQFVSLWGIVVFFLYAMRRVDCAACGVRVERVPWGMGKSEVTVTFAWFLATWAKRMSWQEVADAFQTSWDKVFRSVEMAVDWGKAHRDLGGIVAIGVDEVLWQRGYKFLTVVYQIDRHCTRLLWIGKDRRRETIDGFFKWFGVERSGLLRFVCSDMWKPYLEAIARKASQAINVLDRFHIAAKMNKAIDEVRADESRVLKEKGQHSVLKHARWCLLKRPENLTEKQEIRLADLVRCNLKTVRSYLLKESFQLFWDYVSPTWAAKFLDQWCRQTMRSRIEPMKKIAGTLRAHRGLLLNWFRAKGELSSGSVEGLNNKLKVITRRAYGFRTYRAIEVALYHALGKLPEPAGLNTHRFC